MTMGEKGEGGRQARMTIQSTKLMSLLVRNPKYQILYDNVIVISRFLYPLMKNRGHKKCSIKVNTIQNKGGMLMPTAFAPLSIV